jgi:multiple sugar transport system substrate-binding protein
MKRSLMRRLVLLGVALAVALMLTQFAPPAKAQKTVITWFVGLGTGTNAEQQDVQKKVVEKFNASQSEIELKIDIAADNASAYDALSTLIASGKPPDIVGPVGFSGANAFADQWLDLRPLIEKSKYDIKQFPETLVNSYEEGGGLLGIPFAVFPGLIFYNADLFTEAGLAFPPGKFGEKYKLDGKEVEWDWDTLAVIAQRLTVDSAGNDATSDKFDPSKIVQFGFTHQDALLRAELQTFGGAPVVDPKSGKVVIPEHWREKAKWLHNGIWKDYFIPNATYEASDLLKPNAFESGKIAMKGTMLWFTCCVTKLKAKWDLAVVPTYKGNTYAPADADTFRIMKTTKNPDAAFKVFQYLLGDAALDLLTVYGAYPARPDLQDAAIKALAEKYPSVKNWSIVAPSLAFTTVPHHESFFPNYNKGEQRFADFRTLLYGDAGKSIDVDKELEKLQTDMQAIVDAAPK